MVFRRETAATDADHESSEQAVLGAKAKPDALEAYKDDMPVVTRMSDRAGFMSGGTVQHTDWESSFSCAFETHCGE